MEDGGEVAVMDHQEQQEVDLEAARVIDDGAEESKIDDGAEEGKIDVNIIVAKKTRFLISYKACSHPFFLFHVRMR